MLQLLHPFQCIIDFIRIHHSLNSLHNMDDVIQYSVMPGWILYHVLWSMHYLVCVWWHIDLCILCMNAKAIVRMKSDSNHRNFAFIPCQWSFFINQRLIFWRRCLRLYQILSCLCFVCAFVHYSSRHALSAYDTNEPIANQCGGTKCKHNKVVLKSPTAREKSLWLNL